MIEMKEVQASSIPPVRHTDPDRFQTEYKTDYYKAAVDFWSKTYPQAYADYLNGYATGTFGKNNSSFSSFLNKLFSLIKETLLQQFKKAGIKTDDGKENFQLLELALQMIIKNLSEENVKALNGETVNTIAFLQGCIDSYIISILKEKEKTDSKKEKLA